MHIAHRLHTVSTDGYMHIVYMCAQCLQMLHSVYNMSLHMCTQLSTERLNGCMQPVSTDFKWSNVCMHSGYMSVPCLQTVHSVHRLPAVSACLHSVYELYTVCICVPSVCSISHSTCVCNIYTLCMGKWTYRTFFFARDASFVT